MVEEEGARESQEESGATNIAGMTCMHVNETMEATMKRKATDKLWHPPSLQRQNPNNIYAKEKLHCCTSQ